MPRVWPSKRQKKKKKKKKEEVMSSRSSELSRGLSVNSSEEHGRKAHFWRILAKQIDLARTVGGRRMLR